MSRLLREVPYIWQLLCHCLAQTSPFAIKKYLGGLYQHLQDFETSTFLPPNVPHTQRVLKSHKYLLWDSVILFSFILYFRGGTSRLFNALRKDLVLQKNTSGLALPASFLPLQHTGTGLRAQHSSGNINPGSPCQPQLMFWMFCGCVQGRRCRVQRHSHSAAKDNSPLPGTLPPSITASLGGLAMLQLASKWSYGGGSRQFRWCGMDVSELDPQ